MVVKAAVLTTKSLFARSRVPEGFTVSVPTWSVLLPLGSIANFAAPAIEREALLRKDLLLRRVPAVTFVVPL